MRIGVRRHNVSKLSDKALDKAMKAAGLEATELRGYRRELTVEFDRRAAEKPKGPLGSNPVIVTLVPAEIKVEAPDA